MSTRQFRLGILGSDPLECIREAICLGAPLSGQWEIVAGAFGIDPECRRVFATQHGIDPARMYGSVPDLIAGETGRDDRIDAVAVCSADCAGFDTLAQLMQAGFHVVTRPDMGLSAEDASQLSGLSDASKRLACVAYPLAACAALDRMGELVSRSEIGQVTTAMISNNAGAGRPLTDTAAEHIEQAPAGALRDRIECATQRAFILSWLSTRFEVESLRAGVTSLGDGPHVHQCPYITVRYQAGARGLMLPYKMSDEPFTGFRLQVLGKTGTLTWFESNRDQLVHEDVKSGDTQTITIADRTLGNAGKESRLQSNRPHNSPQPLATTYHQLAGLIRDGKGTGHAGSAPRYGVTCMSRHADALRFRHVVMARYSSQIE